MEYLQCDRCGERYTEEADICWTKAQADEWRQMCEEDGDQARGLVGCPNITCPGELALKEV